MHPVQNKVWSRFASRDTPYQDGASFFPIGLWLEPGYRIHAACGMLHQVGEHQLGTSVQNVAHDNRLLPDGPDERRPGTMAQIARLLPISKKLSPLSFTMAPPHRALSFPLSRVEEVVRKSPFQIPEADVAKLGACDAFHAIRSILAKQQDSA